MFIVNEVFSLRSNTGLEQLEKAIKSPPCAGFRAFRGSIISQNKSNVFCTYFRGQVIDL
jgi:hypothetical protein